MQCCYIEHKKYQMGEYLYRNNKMERSLADTKFWVNKNYDFDVMYKMIRNVIAMRKDLHDWKFLLQ